MIGAIGGGAAVVVAVIVIFIFAVPTQQYALYVDARTESGDGTTDSHLTIKNTGSQALTNLKIVYDTGKPDMIPVLNPGEMIVLSPPATSTTVTITDSQGLTVTKPFSQFNE
ncbi:MAG: hypothetical protein ACREA3_00555 [Nitrosotalea sp.]